MPHLFERVPGFKGMLAVAREGAVYQRKLEDGREMCVYPRIYNSILTIGQQDDKHGYTSHWCYENPIQAIIAAEAWEPTSEAEPEGWFRHAASGRRRPHGSKEDEYIQF